jgi:hypothetical protein
MSSEHERPTVKVKRDGPRGWHFISKEKYDANPKAYELVDDESKADTAKTEKPEAVKGDDGKWYIKLGEEVLGGPFDTKAQAKEELAKS